MADFEKFKNSILEAEGGYQADPDDPGNYNSRGELVGTNHGISARFYERILGYPPSVSDMRAITKEKALQLFRQYFWEPLLADQIRSQAVAETLVDHGINAGKRTAVKLMQRVLNDYFLFDLDIDGIMGSKTLNAINSSPEKQLFDAYNQARIDYYASLGNGKWLRGWINRVNRLWNKYKFGIGLAGLVTLAGIFFLTRKLFGNENA